MAPVTEFRERVFSNIETYSSNENTNFSDKEQRTKKSVKISFVQQNVFV